MTRRRVLVDTGAWLASFSQRDQYHAIAVASLSELRAERARLVVTDLIVGELHLHLVRALDPQRAADLLETVKTDALVEEIFADHNLQTAALGDWIRRFEDQPFTFTDAVSFAVMRADRIGAAFTFDRHFRIAGFETIPSGI